MARFLGWSMSVDPNNPLEITVNLSILDNDFVIVSDIKPVPDLSFFSEIRVFSDHLTCYVEPKSDNLHKLDLVYTANNYSIPKYVSPCGQWTETQMWHFDFDSSIYNEVLNILSGKNLIYLEIGNNPATAILIS
jgi:hypothetical protein